MFGGINMGVNQMADSKAIYCKLCKRKIATWDGKSTITIMVNCKKCKKSIVFTPRTQKTEIKPMLTRNCSSGMRFY